MTPAVAAVGVMGCRPNTGRAWANWAAGIGRANCATGRDAAIALAGTTVAARRLAKLLIVTLLMLVMLVTFRMDVTLTLRM